MTEFINSPFEAHLQTNFAPSDAECDQIRADLAPRLVQLKLLNKHICELTAERDKLQAYVDSHGALISYPRLLPVDIRREIFVACLPTSRKAVMSAQEAPLLLSRICSAWRAIALPTPRLWASIHIPTEFVLKRPEARIPAISEWLRRSGSHPISISLASIGEEERVMSSFDKWEYLKASFARIGVPLGEARYMGFDAQRGVSPGGHDEGCLLGKFCGY